MATGACGIHCDACRLKAEGKCSTCGPADSEEATRKLSAQVRLLGSPCPILECARSRGIPHCLRDCDDFPCERFQAGPYPFSSDFLLMQERRRRAHERRASTRGLVPVDEVHWRGLEVLEPTEVIERGGCLWNPERGFGLQFLGDLYWVNPSQREIRPERPEAPMPPQLPLVLVHFLLNAKDRPLTGRMITEREIPGGAFFFRHLHSLPVHPLEEAFGRRPHSFVEAGLRLGGKRREISPFSFELLPLPGIPVGFHLWPADDEFPARCVITFDSSIAGRLPLDIVWALTQVLVQMLVESA